MEKTDFQNLIFQALNSDDSAAAIQVLVAHKKDPSLELPENVELQLKYVRMMSLSYEQLLALMKQSVLVAYTIPEFDLVEKIKLYLTLLDDTMGEINLIKGIITTLENSEEILGKGTIDTTEGPVKPTLANWIQDYLSIASLEGEKNAFTELQYINTSKNMKALVTVEQKEILKNILKLIDYCIDINDLWELEPTPKSLEEAYPNFDFYNFVPGIREYLNEEDQPAPKPKVAAVKPKAPPAKVVQQSAPSMPHIARDLPTNQYVDELTPGATAPKMSHIARDLPNNQYIDELSRPNPTESPVPDQMQGMKQPPRNNNTLQAWAKPAPVMNNINGRLHEQVANPAKIRELLNSKSAADISEMIKKAQPKPGVVKDDTNISMPEEKQRMEKERMAQIDSIAKKLEDLRSRQKQNP